MRLAPPLHSQVLLDERRASTAELLSLRQQLLEAQHAARSAEGCNVGLQERVTQLEAFLTEARG